MPKVRIGRMQLAAILANLVFGKAIGYSSEIAARAVSNDAWLSMLLSFVQGFVVIAVAAWLAGRFGGERPDQYLPRLLGRPLGAIALGLLTLFLFFSFITSAITIVQHLNDYLMTETPFLVFVVLYVLLCMYGSYLGIEVAARLAIPGLLFTFILTALVVAGSVDHFDYTRLLPLFDHGVGRTFAASHAADTDVAMAVVGAMLLLPLTGKPKRWVRLSWWGPSPPTRRPRLSAT
ncbi:MAG TPA: GerAB/ArcD/ProY family transporter, partial [Symbiobacteriaceae bacterium]|nr:GerAB/ArcD/ProY family transporter [Symbiobacteriaceae bacterium]